MSVTTPTVAAVNNEDGTATVMISDSDAGSTNTLYRLPKWGDAFAWSEVASRVEDGTITLSGVGDYILIVISDDGSSYSFPSTPISISVTNGRRTCLRDNIARAEYQSVRVNPYGLQVSFVNGSQSGATPVNIWVTIEDAEVITQLRNSSLTDVEEITFHAPRQTGFPPADFWPGSSITYGSYVFEITRVMPSNGLNELSSTFMLRCGRFRTAGNY